MEKIMIKFIFPLTVLILSLGAIKPLLMPGFFPMHDDTQPARVYEMTQALKTGQFPVRWVGDLGYGYGYPLFNFYAPLPYYIGGLFNLFGIDAISSTKIMFALGILLAGFCMYLLIRELVGEIAAVTAAVLYMYAPYHAVNIFVRGAVGEYYAYSFIPLLIYAVLLITQSVSSDNTSKLKKGVLSGSLGYAGLLLSHNILALVTSYIIFGWLICYISYLIIKKQKKSSLVILIVTLLLGLGLSAFFTVPALLEKSFTNVDSLTAGGSDFHNHFVYIDQLWDSPWGFGGSAPRREDGISFKIGKANIVFGLVSLFMFFYLLKKKKINNIQIITYISFLTVFFLSVFLQTDTSQTIWQTLPGLAFIQYPWRFLNFTILSLSVLISYLFISLSKTVTILLGVFIITLTIWFNLKYFVPQQFIDATDKDYTSQQTLNYKISQISDEYLPKDFIKQKNPDMIALHGLTDSSNIAVNDIINETFTDKKYEIFVRKQMYTKTGITYFPGWTASIDGVDSPITSNQGRIAINTPAGIHTVEFHLTNTPIRIASNAISIFSLILLVYVSLFWKKGIPWIKNIQ